MEMRKGKRKCEEEEIKGDKQWKNMGKEEKKMGKVEKTGAINFASLSSWS